MWRLTCLMCGVVSLAVALPQKAVEKGVKGESVAEKLPVHLRERTITIPEMQDILYRISDHSHRSQYSRMGGVQRQPRIGLETMLPIFLKLMSSSGGGGGFSPSGIGSLMSLFSGNNGFGSFFGSGSGLGGFGGLSSLFGGGGGGFGDFGEGFFS